MATLSLPKSTEFNDGNLAVGTDVLANDQAIANFLNAQNIDQNNISPSMTPTWTGVHKHGNNVQIISGYDLLLYSDTSTTLKGAWDAATGDIGIAATAKLYLDGADRTGNTYLAETSSDRIELFIGGESALRGSISNRLLEINQSTWSFAIPPTQKLYLDGGGDTYLTESSANAISVYAGGSELLIINSAFGVKVSGANDFSINSAAKLYLDNGGDTYLTESAANQITFYAAAVGAFVIESSQISTAVNLIVAATKKLLFDGSGSGDTYMTESSANELDTYVGGTLVQKSTSSGVSFGAATNAYIDQTASATRINNSGNSASPIIGGYITVTNAGVGGVVGLDLTTLSAATKWAFQFSADATDPTSGGGAAAGRIAVRIGGVTRYLAYY